MAVPAEPGVCILVAWERQPAGIGWVWAVPCFPRPCLRPGPVLPRPRLCPGPVLLCPRVSLPPSTHLRWRLPRARRPRTVSTQAAPQQPCAWPGLGRRRPSKSGVGDPGPPHCLPDLGRVASFHPACACLDCGVRTPRACPLSLHPAACPVPLLVSGTAPTRTPRRSLSPWPPGTARRAPPRMLSPLPGPCGWLLRGACRDTLRPHVP